jgi:hypothetical protein
MTGVPSGEHNGSQSGNGPAAADLTPGRPVVFRNATVRTTPITSGTVPTCSSKAR